jgi:thiol-disulfide isomerase/thioredoxin
VGRLPALTLAALSLGACDNHSANTSTTRGRSETITAADNMPSATATPSASAAHPAAAPARKLCESEVAGPSKGKLPKTTFTPVAAPDAVPIAAQIPSGKWTWINFFAAWCGPCKEEMPRLKDFQRRLSADLDVTFVSVDDDERQLKQFLLGQPAGGVRAALWLQEKPRDTWLTALKLKNPPDLPAHVLVDPSGKVRCVVGGAVEESDFAALASIVKR